MTKGSSGRRMAVAAVGAAAALVAGLTGGAAPKLAGATAASWEQLRNADGELAAVDLARAAELAAAADEPVLVEALTDERTQQRANPDGTITFEQYAEPQRVRRGGGWVPVDTTLRVDGDRIAPVATSLDVSLSAGGTDELVVFTEGTARVALSWPGALPEPVLDGDTATYPEVLPGVDLQVRALPESLAQLLVVKDRQAAANPELERVAWGVSTQGLSLRLGDDGTVAAVDGTGEVVFFAPGSYMWDSRRPEPSAARMPVELVGGAGDSGELVVLPDQDLLKGESTVFPVSIDPEFSRGPANWSPVLRSRPNESWPSGSSFPRDHIRVGYNNWSGCASHCGVWRSHLRFDISAMSGQDLVGNPTFSIRLDHSASCAPSPVQLWQTNTIGASGNVTWNSMSDKWLARVQTRSGNANEAGGCGTIQPDGMMEFSNATLRQRLQPPMDAGNATFTLGLRAADESDPYQWKRFERGSARLVATYNRPPDRPTNLAITGDCFQSCASPAVLRADRPTLSARVTDPNRDVLKTVQFQVRNADRSAVLATSGTSVSNRASGSTATWRTPALPQDVELHWRVRARDVHDAWGPWSGYFTMVIDTTAPFSPTVGSDLYRHVSSGTWNGGVGQPGEFTFGSNHSYDVVAYEWRFADGNVTRVNTSAGADRTVHITPPADLRQSLQVRSIDRAGNTSGWATYSFLVRPQPPDAAYWKFDEGSGDVTHSEVGGDSYRATLHGGATWVDSGINDSSGTAVALDGTGWVESPPVLDTTHPAGFSVSAWVYPSDLSGDRTVLAQDGDQWSMFRLEHRGGENTWCFTVRGATGAGNELARACSPAQPQAGAWTHLVGVFDRPRGTMTLYVNGGGSFFDPTGTTTTVAAPTPWASHGSFAVGRARNAPHEYHAYWQGRVDEVRAHPRALTSAEALQTYLACRLAECPPALEAAPFAVGAWRLDDWADTAADESPFDKHGTLSGAPGTAWSPDGRFGAAVAFDGVSGAIVTTDPVVATDRSFTVASWARPDVALAGDGTVLAQGGEHSDAFRLHHAADVDAWCFTMRDADDPAAGTARACGSVPVAGQWTHLAGVYDAEAGEIRLYVDGQLAGTASRTASPWQASGPLTFGSHSNGNGSAGGFFAGQVDLTRAYLGALTAPQVAALADES